MGKEPQKQITLHFAGEHVKILEWMRKEAKEKFRSTEQHIVYCLDCFIKSIERGSAIVENITRQLEKIDKTDGAQAPSTDEPHAVPADDPVNPEAKEVQ